MRLAVVRLLFEVTRKIDDHAKTCHLPRTRPRCCLRPAGWAGAFESFRPRPSLRCHGRSRRADLRSRGTLLVQPRRHHGDRLRREIPQVRDQRVDARPRPVLRCHGERVSRQPREPGTWRTDMDSGIRSICKNEELTRVTIQRNKIHDPRYSANSWTDGHPAGPQGITFSYCGGNHVIRWNEISGGAQHFNDGMGGEDNFSTAGFPNKDSDIYGNKISRTWDDGIEAEGGNANVRIWGNYMDNTSTGVATTITSVGPVYIFRNVFNRNQFFDKRAHDQDERQPFFKSGSSSDFANGRRYLFHNTMLQATEAGSQYGLGGGAGVGGTGDTQLVHNTVSMNNIYHLWKPNGAVYQVLSLIHI